MSANLKNDIIIISVLVYLVSNESLVGIHDFSLGLNRKRMAASELSKSMNEFLTKLQDDLKEAMNTMMCTKCEGKHKYGILNNVTTINTYLSR